VSTGPRDSDVWQFLKTILDMAVMLLKPNTGKYMTHCTGLNVTRCRFDAFSISSKKF
jgi:hypothetical protein